MQRVTQEAFIPAGEVAMGKGFIPIGKRPVGRDSRAEDRSRKEEMAESRERGERGLLP